MTKVLSVLKLVASKSIVTLDSSMERLDVKAHLGPVLGGVKFNDFQKNVTVTAKLLVDGKIPLTFMPKTPLWLVTKISQLRGVPNIQDGEYGYFSIFLGDRGNVMLSEEAKIELEFEVVTELAANVTPTVSSFESFNATNELVFISKKVLETENNKTVNVAEFDYLFTDSAKVSNIFQKFQGNKIVEYSADYEARYNRYQEHTSGIVHICPTPYPLSMMTLSRGARDVKSLFCNVTGDTTAYLVSTKKYIN